MTKTVLRCWTIECVGFREFQKGFDIESSSFEYKKSSVHIKKIIQENLKKLNFWSSFTGLHSVTGDFHLIFRYKTIQPNKNSEFTIYFDLFILNLNVVTQIDKDINDQDIWK